MKTQPQPLRIGWLGATSDGLGWLHARLGAFHSPRIASVAMTTRPHWELPGSSLDQLLSQGLDRLIFACSNRLDYPLAQLEWVQATYPELPCGLAMSSYWDGARRTGLGLLPHIAFPWHRWWDGWVAWLEATSASWFGPCIDARTATHPQPQTVAHSLGRIIANCQQTAHAWRLAAQQAGATVSHFSPSGLDADPVDPGEIDWILWDDSCLSTHTGPHDELAVRSVTELSQRFPRARLACAFSMPRWELWRQLQLHAAHDLLCKPSAGSGLQRMLADLHHEAPAVRFSSAALGRT